MTASAIFSTGCLFLSSSSAPFKSELLRKLDPVKESGIINETLTSYSSCCNVRKKLWTADFDAQYRVLCESAIWPDSDPMTTICPFDSRRGRRACLVISTVPMKLISITLRTTSISSILPKTECAATPAARTRISSLPKCYIVNLTRSSHWDSEVASATL